MQILEVFTHANSHTVLQTYRQAFSIPQMNCIYWIFLSSWLHDFALSTLNFKTLKVIWLGWGLNSRLFEKNTYSCLSQLSYWNRQEKRQFFRALSLRRTKTNFKFENDRGEQEWHCMVSFLLEALASDVGKSSLNTHLAPTIPRYTRELTSNLVFNCIYVNLTCGCSWKKTHHKVS